MTICLIVYGFVAIWVFILGAATSLDDPRICVGRAIVWPLALAAEGVRCVRAWGRDYLSGWLE